MIEKMEEAPITAKQVAAWTRRDPVLSKVHQYIQNGWPSQAEDDLKPYWSRRLELSFLNGCVFWGSRIVIPPPGRESFLIELYGGHPGISRIKSVA